MRSTSSVIWILNAIIEIFQDIIALASTDILLHTFFLLVEGYL